jgi:uncharacterized protein YjiS (DUF1127 family)
MEAQLINPYLGRRADAASHADEQAGPWQRLLGWLDESRRYRRTRSELAELSDRELDDIGLCRGEIEAVARRCAQR